MRELLTRGLQLQQEMANKGKEHRQYCKNKLEELRVSVEEARKAREALEAVKNQAMEAETQALQKYKDADAERKREQEELEMQRHQEEEKEHAREAFTELDLDGNGMLTAEELQKNIIFDQNRDGTVSVEEGQVLLAHEGRNGPGGVLDHRLDDHEAHLHREQDASCCRNNAASTSTACG
ncbi:hypothetical protein MTO96_002354 [Rhipicephalus appendiculatus]